MATVHPPFTQTICHYWS